MMKIGNFAKIFGVTVKTVRYYEKKELITPYYVDNFSRYRYYNEENVKRMEEILFLKDLGFSLDEIKNFGQKQIINKIADYENMILDMQDKVKMLKFFSSNECYKVNEMVDKVNIKSDDF